jgi:hypothetical protein
MRAITLLLTIFFFSQAVYPQRKYRDGTGTKFIVRAGVNLHSFYGTDFWGEELRNQFQPGFSAGGEIDIPVAPDFYLRAGILIHNKGTRQDTVAGSIKIATLYYAEIPLNILFRPQLGDGHLLIGFGPYAAYGIAGRELIKTGGNTEKLKVKFADNAADQPTSYSYYRPWDAGAGFLFGYELYSSVFFQVDAQLGLLRINPGYGLANDKTSRRNIGFGFSSGFRF